jgi:glycerol-3-phosphate acyltransferase PlsY
MSYEFVLLSIAAYLLGSVPAAYLLAKCFYGIDIRKHGTGKIGASNVLRTTSKWLAIPVAIFDIGKGALMVWAAQLLVLGAAAQITVGIITIIGHNWPIFLRFQGGRGVFTSLGVITIISPWLGLIIFVMPYTLAPIRKVALGVFFALVSLPFFSYFLSQPLGIEDRLPITLGFVAMSLIGLFKRLVTPRTELSKSVPLGELMINRLLFDRDIRDAKTWTERKSKI